MSTLTERARSIVKAGGLALPAFFFFPGLARAAPPATDAVWKRIAEGGVAVMIRHAQTVPGVGDPPEFRLDECSTQRNLSAEGRTQATLLGAAFKARGTEPAQSTAVKKLIAGVKPGELLVLVTRQVNITS